MQTETWFSYAAIRPKRHSRFMMVSYRTVRKRSEQLHDTIRENGRYHSPWSSMLIQGSASVALQPWLREQQLQSGRFSRYFPRWFDSVLALWSVHVPGNLPKPFSAFSLSFYAGETSKALELELSRTFQQMILRAHRYCPLILRKLIFCQKWTGAKLPWMRPHRGPETGSQIKIQDLPKT